MKSENFNNFTDEELEFLRCILLERSTYFTRLVIEDTVKKGKAPTEKLADVIQKEITFNLKRHEVVSKLLNLLK